ncbi:MAG TPA: TetR/AcrR family transcriptional regulator [Gaiellaceae bacterium]|jgi:AcrR family transcriptional regulator
MATTPRSELRERKQPAPRKSRSDGERSRRTILDAAAKLATTEGLDGLSIGGLADHIGMSKSGLYAHFGSKKELQLATIEAAGEIFSADVIAPAEEAETPLARLELLCELFLSHLERRVFPGGCFFASAAAEFDTRPGVVRESIAEFQRGWMELMAQLIHEAQEAGELRKEDPDQLAFELDGYLMMANQAFLILNDPGAIQRARTAVAARLALSRTNP